MSADFAQLARISRRALHMYDLTERERRVSEVIIEWSFGRGREAALIPELDAFVDLTGLDRGDVSRAMQRLVDRGIVQLSGNRGARTYAFIPSAAFWNERKPLYDMERALARAHELEKINVMANETPAVEPSGQSKLPLPADEPGLDEGVAMAARDDALAIGESPMTGSVGKTPMTGSVGESPIPPRDARTCARDVLQNVSTKRIAVHVGGSPKTQKRFANDEKNHVFELLESLAGRQQRDRDDFSRNRFTWLRRFGDQDFSIIRRALGIVRDHEQNPKNKRDKPLGAVLFRECVKLAQAVGKTFR